MTSFNFFAFDVYFLLEICHVLGLSYVHFESDNLLFLFSLLSCSSISVILFVVNATSSANRRLVRVSPSMLSPLSRSTV